MLCYSVSTRFLMRERWKGQNERRCDAGSRRSEVRCDVSRGPQVRRKEARLAYRQSKGPQAKECRCTLKAGKGREHTPLDPLEGDSPEDTLISTQ